MHKIYLPLLYMFHIVSSHRLVGTFQSEKKHTDPGPSLACRAVQNSLDVLLSPFPASQVPRAHHTQTSIRSYTPIHIMLTTISIPLLSPPSNLKLHMPSRSLFQYAPLALCMPRRPTLLTSPAFSASASASLPVLRGSLRCWMIVLLTANL